MTKYEMIKSNKERYLKCQLWAHEQEGLPMFVANYVTLAWIKGVNWEGGLGAGKRGDRCFERVMELGYTYEEVKAEFDRQMDMF